MAIAQLLRRSRAAASKEPQVQELIREIFMGIVVEADADISRRLAEKLAPAAWAPVALIHVLALDDIEIARPIIAASPLLNDDDLVRLLVEATLEHQIEVARRPGIGATVVSAILDQSDPAVITALAANDTADVSAAMAHVAAGERVRRRVGGHARPGRPSSQTHFGQAGPQFPLRLGRRNPARRPGVAVRTRSRRPDPGDFGCSEGRPRGRARRPLRSRPNGPPAWERDQMEQRLIAKLDAAGQLRPGYLLRALREGKMSMFEAALATLAGFTTKQVHQALLMAGRPELLAMACVAVGIDRSVFPTLLSLVQQAARRARPMNGRILADGAASARLQPWSRPRPPPRRSGDAVAAI